MTEAEQQLNDANDGESEGVPEQLNEHEIDRNGRADNRRWRYAVRDLESLDHAGPGIWRQIGPAPLQVGAQQLFQGIGPNSGEVVDIALDRRGGDQRVMYAAAGHGGLWRSDDAGATWRPLTDQLPATAIGAVALDPVDPDIVYAGSGNLFAGAVGMSKAAGIFKSVDGGRSWSRLTSPAGRPPQPITAALNVAGGVRVTVAGHGYASLDRVVATGLPGVVGAAGEGTVRRLGVDTLRIGGVTMNAAYGGAGATLFDARQPPFLSDRGIIRMVCPSGGALLVAAETGLYYSKDHGRNFGANVPAYDDGRPIRTGLISALEVDQGWNRSLRVVDATPTAPIRVTFPGHGFLSGDPVTLGGVTTNRAANGTWTLDVVDADHVTLRGSSGNGTGAVTGFAIGPAHPVSRPVTGATNPAAPNPIVITAAGHGFVTGDIVAVSGVGGNTAANGSWVIRVLGPDTFSLNGSRGNAAHSGGGVVDGPRHPPPRPVTAAVNSPGGVRVTSAGHGLVEDDRVGVTGLPGIVAPGNSARVHVIDPDTFRLSNLTMNAVYGGGATVSGPADSWNTVYFASAGRLLNSTVTNPDWGLYRLAVTSTGEVVISGNLMANPGIPAGPFGRVAFCQSLLPRTRELYLSVQNNEAAGGGVFVGLFRSTDFGGTWNPRPALVPRVNTDGGGQSNYDMVVAVDPQDARRVYTAQQQLWRSTDGGATWPLTQPVSAGGVDALGTVGRAASLTLLHWDHHELVFAPPTWWEWTGGNPVTPTPAYHGTDGGVARSDTDATGRMAVTSLNEGLATSLLLSLDIGRGAGSNAVSFGGMQDTGTGGHRAGTGDGGWTAGQNGDGGPVAVDPFDPDIVFGFTNGNLIRTTNGGRTWFMANTPARVEIEAVANTNPVRVTTAGHPFRSGDTVTISGVAGGGGLANGAATITVPAGDTRSFTLNGRNGVAVAPFGPLPTATGNRYLVERAITVATLQAPIQIETGTPHGLVTGQRVRIDAVAGNLAANNTVARPSWVVTVISPTRFSLDGSDGSLALPYVRGTGRMRGPAVGTPVPVFATTNANPIVVTARGHGFVSGEAVTIAGVTGNTAANVAGQVITVLDRNSFVLNGVAGNGAPGPVPRAALFQSIGRNGVTVGAYQARISLVPQVGAPSSVVFLAMRNILFRSTNGGISFVAMSTFTNDISAVHAPAVDRLWVATGNLFGTNRQYRVHFSTNQGASYHGAAQNFVGDVGARSFVSQIIEDPNGGGQRVAVVCAGYSDTHTARRTRHVFLTASRGTTTGGVVPWREVGGVFNAASGNLPDIPVLGAAWDHSANPSQLLVATDSGVLRLDPAGPRWTRVGPNLPKVGLTAIVSDTTVPAAPRPVVRVSSYGRSAWQLEVPDGPSLFVEADLGFGDQQVGTTVRRRMVLHSVGSGPVEVTGISGSTGDVTVVSVPAGATFPLTLASGARRAFDVVFTPSATGNRGAFLGVGSNDPAHPLTEVKVTGFGIAAGAPRLSVRAFLEFGVVRTGQPSQIALEVRNVGDGPMPLTALTLDGAGSPRFGLVAPPALPLTIPPSGSVSVTVRFDPTANGPVSGALIVRGGGQGQVVTLAGQGTTSAAGMVAVLFQQLGIGEPQEALA